MQYRVRKGIFETNSSSCHCLTYNEDSLKPNDMTLDDGYIDIECQSYDERYGIYSSQYEKLAYIVNHIVFTRYEGRRMYIDKDEDYYLYLIENCLKNYIPGFKGLRIHHSENAEFNHQLSGSYDIDCIVNLWDDNSILNVIFNDNIMIKVYRD